MNEKNKLEEIRFRMFTNARWKRRDRARDPTESVIKQIEAASEKRFTRRHARSEVGIIEMQRKKEQNGGREGGREGKKEGYESVPEFQRDHAKGYRVPIPVEVEFMCWRRSMGRESKEAWNSEGRKYFSSATSTTMMADTRVEMVWGCKGVVIVGIVRSVGDNSPLSWLTALFSHSLQCSSRSVLSMAEMLRAQRRMRSLEGAHQLQAAWLAIKQLLLPQPSHPGVRFMHSSVIPDVCPNCHFPSLFECVYYYSKTFPRTHQPVIERTHNHI